MDYVSAMARPTDFEYFFYTSHPGKCEREDKKKFNKYNMYNCNYFISVI